MKTSINHRLLTLLVLFALMATKALGQELRVLYVAGKVTTKTQTGDKRVMTNDMISYESIVSIPPEGKLELIDAKQSAKIVLHKAGSNKVSALAKQSDNSITQLSAKYLAYITKQLTNKGLTSKQRLTDFATVTREQQEEETRNALSDLRDRFDMGLNQMRTGFYDFRDSISQVYVDFVRKAWIAVQAQKRKSRPKDTPAVPSVEDDGETVPESNYLMREYEQFSKTYMPDVAVEVVPPFEVKEGELTLDERIDDDLYDSKMPFTFYGTPMEVRLVEEMRFNLGHVVPDNLAEALKFFCSARYDNLLVDCLRLKAEHQLCDWAYMLMLKTICDQFLGVETNEANLLLGYLLGQSGYKLRYAKDDTRLFVLLACDGQLYDKEYFIIDDEYYYPIVDVPTQMTFCQASYPQEKALSLFIRKPMRLDYKASTLRNAKSRLYPELSVEMEVNQNLLDFYADYPTGYTGGDATTRWLIYAHSPFDEKTLQGVVASLGKQTRGLSKSEVVDRLLNLIQTGMEYKTDEQVWGEDRVFFCEETLAYPYCDCEDRAILFVRLVKELTGLDGVLLHYPGHLASAICFEEGHTGYFYELGGRRYTVCDPTYIGAKPGMVPRSYRSEKPVIIKL